MRRCVQTFDWKCKWQWKCECKCALLCTVCNFCLTHVICELKVPILNLIKSGVTIWHYIIKLFQQLSFFSALLFMVTSAKAGEAAPTSRLGNLRGHSSHSDWELGNFDVWLHVKCINRLLPWSANAKPGTSTVLQYLILFWSVTLVLGLTSTKLFLSQPRLNLHQ